VLRKAYTTAGEQNIYHQGGHSAAIHLARIGLTHGDYENHLAPNGWVSLVVRWQLATFMSNRIERLSSVCKISSGLGREEMALYLTQASLGE